MALTERVVKATLLFRVSTGKDPRATAAKATRHCAKAQKGKHTMKNIVNSHNTVHTYFTEVPVKYGTRFGQFLDNLEFAGYIDGWNHVAHTKKWVWFKHVGCSGYEYIEVTKEQRKEIIRRARALLRSPLRFWGPDYWSYKECDKNYSSDDNGTNTRNARLARENFVKFMAHLVSGR